MLRDVSTVDMKTRILGGEVAFPVCVGATAMQRMAHIDGELATARGIDSEECHSRCVRIEVCLLKRGKRSSK